jgi:hypothetical protein
MNDNRLANVVVLATASSPHHMAYLTQRRKEATLLNLKTEIPLKPLLELSRRCERMFSSQKQTPIRGPKIGVWCRWHFLRRPGRLRFKCL